MAEFANIETRLFINGEFTPSIRGKTFKLINPATDKSTAEIYEGGAEDVDLAVQSAKNAFPAWAEDEASDRQCILQKLADLVEQHAAQFAYLDAISMGKPLSTYIDHTLAVATIRYFAGKAYDAHGITSLGSKDHLNISLRQPYGVTGAIIPWNVPLVMLAFKVAPALMAGNTMVLRSSERAPLSPLLFARLAKEAGLPPGVLNVLSGFGNPCGDAIARHMEIRKISFTGSHATGKIVQRAAAESNLKVCTLELGGKSPLIVFEDADLEKAAAAAAFSITFNSGQICMACTRVYVHTSDNISKALQKAADDGLEFILGGRPLEGKGCFIPPAVVLHPPEQSDIMKKEIFGAISCVSTFTNEEDVLARANDTEYGLYASVFTRDLNRAIRIAKGFEAGAVGVNTASPYYSQDLPLGGYKSSGSGRELGQEGLESWTEVKSVYIDLT
ncbi:aldehyde dehydrogenase [Trichoderma afarasin]